MAYRIETDLSSFCHDKLRNGDNKNQFQFLPADEIPRIVTSANVTAALDNPSTALVEFICKHVPKIFLILTLLGEIQSAFFELLKKNDIHDESLPWDFTYDKSTYCFYSLKDGSNSNLFTINLEWRPNERNLFRTYQASIMSPVFGPPAPFHVDLHKMCILPFLSFDAPEESSSGFFGEVRKKLIHPAHLSEWFIQLLKDNNLFHIDKETGGIAVALKTAKQKDEVTRFADKEKTNLEGAARFNSRYIVKSIASFKRRDKHCLLFPWANGGHLGKYWSEHGTGPLEREDVTWLLEQVRGICSGLIELHAINWRHGDLKPDNILWFRGSNDRGSLQIADLGLATFHPAGEGTEIRDASTKTPSGTCRYEPPQEEERRRDKDMPRSRFYDTWSLGCILLELLIWALYGSSEVKVFRTHSQTYFWVTPRTGVYELGPGVKRYIRVIKENKNLCDAYRDLLTLIETRLLVIDIRSSYETPATHQAMAHRDTRYRAMANEAEESISRIYDKCLRDGSYLSIESLSRSIASGIAERSPSTHSVIDDKLAPKRSNPSSRNGREPTLRSPKSSQFDELLTVTPSKADMIPRIVADSVDAADDGVDEQTADVSQLTVQDTVHQKEVCPFTS
jgi:serine/threonine protein kinase